MDNKKIKKLLVATLAASSTFSALDAVAGQVDYVAGANAQINIGAGSIDLNSAAAANPNIAANTPSYVFISRATATATSNQAASNAGITLNLLGNAGAEYTLSADIDGSAASNLVIVNDYSQDMLKRAGYGNVAGGGALANDQAAIAAGGAIAAAAQNANATINLKIDADNRKVVKLSLDTISRIGEVDFDAKQNAKFSINVGSDKREDVTDASTSTIKTKFHNAGVGSVVEVNAENKWIALKNDASDANLLLTAGNVLLNESSNRNATLDEKGTLYILEGKTLDGNVDGTDNGKGTLILEGGNVTGDIGGGHKLALVRHTGKESTVTGAAIKATKLELGGDEKLVLTNLVHAGTEVVATKEGAILEYKVAANTALTDIKLAEGVNNAVISLAAGKNFTVAKSIENATLNLADAGAVIKFADAKGTAKPITTSTANQGKVEYDGEATISANIGTSEKPIAELQFSAVADKHATIKSGVEVYSKDIKFGAVGGQVVKVEENTKVVGDIAFTANQNQVLKLEKGVNLKGDIAFGNGAGQVVKIGSGATVSGAITSANANNSTVEAQAGATVGDVVLNPGAASAFKFTGGGNLTGQAYRAFAVTFDGGEYKVSNEGKDIGIANLNTKNNAVIDSSASKLVLVAGNNIPGGAADNTKIADGTTFKIKHEADALEVTGVVGDKFGSTNIALNSEAIIKEKGKDLTYEQLVGDDETKSLESVNLIKGVENEEHGKKFKLVQGSILKHELKFANVNGANYLVLDTDFDKKAVEELGSANDVKKPLGALALEMLSEANSTGDLEGVKRKYAALQSDAANLTTLAYITNGAENVLDSINNPGSDAAVASGEEYNEMGVRAFVAPFVARGTTKLNGSIVGNNLNVSGASFGATVGVNEDNTHLGLAMTFANSTTKYKDAKDGDKLKGQTRAVTLFGDQVFGDNIVAQGVLTLGVTDYKANLASNYTGKYTAKFGSLLAKVGYNMNAGNNFKVMPYVGLRYDSFKEDSYTLELNNVKQNVEGKTLNRYVASLGTKFTGSIEMEGTHLAPFADVSFGYGLGQKGSAKKVDLGNFNVNADYSNQDKSIVSGKLGVEAEMQSGLGVALNGGLNLIGNKTTVYSGSLKLGYKF